MVAVIELRLPFDDARNGSRRDSSAITINDDHCIRQTCAYLRGMLRKNPFIRPMAPTMAKIPPVGDEWLHEVKFDGWRAQVHIDDGDATIYSRNGADLTKRFRALKPVIEMIPARSAIIDCELVACGEDGLPCFRTLMDHPRDAPLCLWAFDLLAVDGGRIIPLTLTERKAQLAELIAAADTEHIQFSGAFADPIKLLATCERMGLEGIVSKRRESSYRSGPTRDWVKCKTAAWKAGNHDRFELLHKR